MFDGLHSYTVILLAKKTKQHTHFLNYIYICNNNKSSGNENKTLPLPQQLFCLWRFPQSCFLFLACPPILTSAAVSLSMHYSAYL